MSRTKRHIITAVIFGLAYLFISVMPYGDAVELKKSLYLIPDIIGEWAGNKASKQEDEFHLHVDQYIYREYVGTNGQSTLLNISYWEKFKHDADIFSGNHIDPGYLWDTIREKDIFIEYNSKKFSVKEIVYAKGNNYISQIYWYYTNRGITTRRFRERLVNGIDAMRNNKTNVALIKITSKQYLNKIPPEVMSAQVDFAEKMLPLLTEFLPFD